MQTTSTTPLFPLSTVLFPGGYLPLQIFEVRYLDLIRRCLRDKTGFGVVSLIDGNEVRRPEEQISLARYGTLVRLEDCEALSPSLLKVRTVGTQRFELLSAKQEKGGLWVGEVRVLDDDLPVAVPQELQPCADKLAEVLADLDQQEIPPDQFPFIKPYALGDCAWVANRWCELLPLPKSTKLQLLALENPLLRLELVNDSLQAEGLL